MNNFETAVNATTEAELSQGATLRQNSVHMQSLEALTEAFAQQWEKFVLGEGGLQDAAKWFVKLGTQILEVINGLGGLKTILTTLIGIAITKKVMTLVTKTGELITKTGGLRNALLNLIVALIQGETKSKGLALGFTTAATAANTLNLALGVVSVALGAMFILYQKHKSDQEEFWNSAIENIDETTDKLKTAQTEFDKFNDLTQLEGMSLDALKFELDKLNSGYSDEIDKINDTTKAREESIAKISSLIRFKIAVLSRLTSLILVFKAQILPFRSFSK